MRNLKFALSAAAILLVGAMAVGLAARAVVSPRVGEVRSAGVAAIPTVLGQTAEEVLFYPWPMYDTQPLRHPTEDELLYRDWYDFPNWQVLLSAGFRLLLLADISPDGMFPALEWDFGDWESGPLADISPDKLLSALEWNVGVQGNSPSYGTHIFLKDFPAAARLGEEGTETPVILDFAAGIGSETSVSFLVKPALARELTGEEQAAALEQVEQDLRLLLSENLFYSHSYPYSEMDRLLPEDIPYFDSGEDPPYFHSGLYWLLQIFRHYCIRANVMPRDLIGLFMDDRWMLIEWLDRALEDPYEAPMEELLSAVEQSGLWNIQIITTPRQIVALFTGNSGVMFGVYYDIQLGCYSGIGLTG